MSEEALGSFPLDQLADRSHPVPVSFAQRRLWFLDWLVPGGCAYVIPECAWLGGSLDVGVLGESLRVLVRRHEALRTVFATVGGEPVQVILPAAGVGAVLEVAGGDGAGGDGAEGVLGEWLRRPFDLAAGPVVRAVVVRSGQGWLFGLCVHHVAADGWSVGVLLRELAEVYAAGAAGREPVLAPVVVGYADYAVWQRGVLGSGVAEEQLAYWAGRLDGGPGVLGLPLDRPRPVVQSFAGGRVAFGVDGVLAGGLAGVGRARGATLFMVLLAVFEVLLSRYSGERDLVVGVPVAGRQRVELEPVVGFFVNTLALRVDVSGDPSFGVLVDRVRECALGGFAHQDLPFEVLVERLAPRRVLSHNPVFQVMFALQNLPVVPLVLPGVAVRPVVVDNGTSKFDLSLDVTEAGGGLSAVLEYDGALFDRVTVERMAGHFVNLCRAVVAGPGVPVSALAMVGADERREVVGLGAGPGAGPGGGAVHELVAARAVSAPGAVAVECGGLVLTYRELEEQAGALAGRLAGAGAGPDVVVGVCLGRGLELVVALLGVLKAGAAYLPLDPGYPAGRVTRILDQAGVRVLITGPGAGPPAGAGVSRVLTLAPGPAPVAAGPAVGAVSEPPGPAADPGGLAYLIYTSGSTGSPKGVMIPHHALTNHARFFVRACQLRATDKVLQFASVAFDTAAEEIWPVLTIGGTLVLGDVGGMTFGRLEQLCTEAGVTVLDLPTAYWDRWAAELASGNGIVPPAVRLVVVGGETLCGPALAAWSSVAPSVPVCNTYGPTETTIIATFAADLPASAEQPPIGTAIDGVQVYVVDDGMDVQPVGVPGELCVGGAGVARGYHGEPGRSAGRFVPDPFGPPGSVLYRTGDRARLLPGGQLAFLGRLDRQVKIRGFRVEPAEAEAVLRAHPGIRDALVVARDDDALGRHLVAYVTGDISASDLRSVQEHMRRLLPDYLLPERLGIVAELPLTVNGKIDRNALPDTEAAFADDEYEPPRGPAEERLARIVADLLKVPVVGRYDNFFRLGGNSLLATALVARIKAGFGVDVPLQTVFSEPHVAGLAAAVASARREPPAAAVSANARAAYELSPADLDVAAPHTKRD